MKIRIDGREIDVKGKRTLLEVAKENDIFIPSLCDHPRLVPFAGCRLCLVEVKGKKSYIPSCSTYVDEGMEVKTKTPKLQKLRKNILELILSEHPNACLVCSEKENCDEFKSTIRKVGEVTGCVLCPNNGYCALQEIVETLNIRKIEFPSFYRDFDIKKSDPFFDRNYNLCILCGRCVRICQEVRGASALSFVYRGSQAIIGTVLDRPLLESGCQFCGACIDVCPTGALTERGLKYQALSDETKTTICPLCSIGCELQIELKERRILRSIPVEKGETNQDQACVKGRFTIRDIVYSSKRILRPLVRVNQEFKEVNWEIALDFIAEKLKKYKGKNVALVGSPQATCEDFFLFHKFAREVLKTENIDSPVLFSPLVTCLEMARESGLKLDLNYKIENIAKAKNLFLIGEDIPVSHPIIWLELLEAVRNGAKLIIESPVELSMNRFSSFWLKIKPGTDFYLLNYLSKILIESGREKNLSQIKGFDSFKNSLYRLDFSNFSEKTGISEGELREVSEVLLNGEPTAFLFGIGLTQHPWGSQNMAALWNLAQLVQAQLYPLGLENNLRGIFEIRRHFSVKGIPYNQIIQAASKGDIKALYLAGQIPSFNRDNLELLVIQDSYMNENMKKADVVLPATSFAETDGVFVNTEGRVQKLNKVIDPFEDAKPDWWILSKIAQKMGHEDFKFRNPSEVMKEMSKAIPCFSDISYAKLAKGKNYFVREEKKVQRQFIPLAEDFSSYKASKKHPFLLFINYDLDYYRSLSLPKEIKGLRRIRDSSWIEISLEDAENLGLKDGDNVNVESPAGRIKGSVRISEPVPKGTLRAHLLWSEDSYFSMAHVAYAFSQESESLGMIPVKIKKVK